MFARRVIGGVDERRIKNYDASFVNIVLDEAGAIRLSLIIIINDATADKGANPNLSDGDTIALLTAIAGG